MKQFDPDRPRFASYGFTCEKWVPQAMPRADQHDEIELNYLTSGSLTYLMGGQRAVVPAQTLAAFWATVPHQIVEYTGNEPYYVATIPFAWYLKWGIGAQLHDRLLQWEMVLDAAPCEPAREQLKFEQWMNDVNDKWLEPAVALEIQARLLRMARSLSNVSPPTNSEHRIPLESHDKAEQMACQISRCYKEKLSIPQIAAEVDLHPDYAATLFKKTYGTTIVNFITRHRVAHAQRLLLSTESPIIIVAEQSGFDSLSRFNRAFKQFTGLTPREYRKTLR